MQSGPPRGPAAIKTKLGWTLQGPARGLPQYCQPQSFLLTSTNPSTTELIHNVERLWQVDTLSFRSAKLVTRSKEDQEAIALLESKTVRVEVEGITRYATPLLRRKNAPYFQVSPEAVMPSLRSTERRLLKDPEKAAAYCAEIKKLDVAGSVAKLSTPGIVEGGESWFIPHHMVQHNQKNCIVFNCSYEYRGLNLNNSLLPGPTLGPSLLGVLLHFRQHSVAISGDIRGMFHQV